MASIVPEMEEIVEIKVRKVSNGYVVEFLSDSESKEVVCLKRRHVLNVIKEVFTEA